MVVAFCNNVLMLVFLAVSAARSVLVLACDFTELVGITLPQTLQR
jgi:hypothetical protein